MDKEKNIEIKSNLSDNQLDEIISHLDEYGTTVDKYCYGLPTNDLHMKEMRQLIRAIIIYNE